MSAKVTGSVSPDAPETAAGAPGAGKLSASQESCAGTASHSTPGNRHSSGFAFTTPSYPGTGKLCYKCSRSRPIFWCYY